MADSKNKFYKLGSENEMLKSKIIDRGIGYDASNRRDEETMNLSQMHAEQIPEFIFI